jgi:hypothetical protein
MSASNSPRDDLGLLARLERLDASTLSDANKSLRVLPAAIRPDALCSSMADGVSLFDKLNFDEHVKNLRAARPARSHSMRNWRG